MTADDLYVKSGVNTQEAANAVSLIKDIVTSTYNKRVINGFGGFAGAYDASFLHSYRHPVLVTSTDGVGTKLHIADRVSNYKNIGQDLVAMIADDIIATGLTTVFFC